jgi:cyclohexadienyl dehydratase
MELMSAPARLLWTALASLALAGCATTADPPRPPPARFAEAGAAAALAQAVDERLAVMQDVAVAKWLSGAPIRDAEREAAVLQQVTRDATMLGLEPAGVRDFFEVQIRVARDQQQRWHDAWKQAGACLPCATPPDLPQVRERIDATNRRQLAALQLLAPLRDDARAALAASLSATAPRHGLPATDVERLAATAAAVVRSPPGAVLEQALAAGMLRIGTTGDYAPFSLADDAGLAGADIEMGRALARHLGVEPVFVRTSWPTLRDDLRDGRFDVALSGISYTADRAEVGLFSAPYHEGGKTLLARCSDRARFGTPAGLDVPGVRVIVNPGGTNERYVREHVRVAQVIVFPDNRAIAAELAAGRADVMVTDDVEAELQARRRPGVLCRTYPGTLTRGEKRILMQRDPALQAAVDAWLAAAIAGGLPSRELERAMGDYAGSDAAR